MTGSPLADAGAMARPPAMTKPAAPQQAFIRLVPRGGARSAKQILNQLMYLSRGGELPLRRSERHFTILLRKADLKDVAHGWVREAGFCKGEGDAGRPGQALTTHLIISFPPGTDAARAFIIGCGWAQEMFGSGRHGGTFDYLTACHDDRPHPHIHLVVHRRALEGHWLKISRRHPQLNYDRLRETMAAVAQAHGISLEATSRAARGISERPINYAEYRRARRAAGDYPPPPPHSIKSEEAL